VSTASFNREAEVAGHGDSVEEAIDSSLYMQGHVSPIVVGATADGGPRSSQLEIERVRDANGRTRRAPRSNRNRSASFNVEDAR